MILLLVVLALLGWFMKFDAIIRTKSAGQLENGIAILQLRRACGHYLKMWVLDLRMTGHVWCN
jgi:hypothetical protein